MRIQHNIMAMSAYRNYNTNTSAVAKNLEKLSSGYKINRAGDDAAGLAISEKMRAQITGLNAAQKNVKDGISLVKTAEGAMQEIQDMLNRMDYLATQSANGTYDDDVDRAALQKEVDQLKSEINRIADSANFNGIKLLNGDMDQGGRAVKGDFTLPDVGKPLGDATYLHKGGTAEQGTEFTVNLDTLQASLKAGEKLTMEVGDELTLEITAAADTDYTTKDLADAFKAEFDKTTAADGKINAEDFTATVDDKGNITFKQNNPPTSASEVVNANLDVKISYTDAKGGAPVQLDGGIVTQAAGSLEGTAGSAIALDGTPGKAAVYSVDLTGKDQDAVDGKKIDGVAITKGADLNATMNAFVEAYNGTTGKGYTASWENNKLTLTAKTEGTVTTAPQTDISGSDADMTEDVAGVDEVAATKTVDASKLNKDAITGAADTAGAATGDKVTIVKDANSNKLQLKVGDKVVATSVGEAAAGEVKFTADGDAASVDFGSITIAGNGAGASDFATAVETGLSFKVAGEVTPPEETTTVASGAIAMTGVTADTADPDATLSAADVATLKNLFKAGTTVKVDGKIDVDLSGVADGLKTDGTTTVEDLAKAILAKAQTAVDAWNKANGDTEGFTYENLRISTTNDATGVMPLAPAGDLFVIAEKTPKADPAPGAGTPISGNYNAATVNNKQGAVEGAGQYASTKFDLSDIGNLDSAKLKIGDTEYTFKLGDADSVDGNVITINKNAANLVHQAGELLSRATHDAFSIGHEGNGKIVIDELPGNTKYLDKLASKEGFESLFSYSYTSAKDDSKGLTLQIGDTSEDYNQLKVSIGDMHTAAMNLANLDISKQTDAQDAIQTIRDAINYVSGVRGDLGATQNRLEHTANNLSVMAENIQDAESTIRDTDIAEEMMSYTKNNILVQSAQAMLAQANQVPQGVLQLLG